MEHDSERDSAGLPLAMQKLTIAPTLSCSGCIKSLHLALEMIYELLTRTFRANPCHEANYFPFAFSPISTSRISQALVLPSRVGSTS